MKKAIFFLLSPFLLGTQIMMAQYSKVSFKTKEPLQLWVDGTAVNDQAANFFKLRLNRGRQYKIAFQTASGKEVVSSNIAIGEEERKSDYVIKYKKRQQRYLFILKSAKDQVSVADGLRSLGKVSYSVKKTEVRADENGISGSHSESSGGFDGGALGDTVDGVSSLFKNGKKKRLKDDKTVVLLKIK